MHTQKLQQILQDATQVYRKGELVQLRQEGCVDVVEISGYDHITDRPSADSLDNVDMIFVDVVVDKTKAKLYRADLTRILHEYPQPERLAGGPSYIELAPNLGMEQEGALRLMALGKTLGLWEIMSGKTFGMDDQEAIQLAGHGILMISGYKG